MLLGLTIARESRFIDEGDGNHLVLLHHGQRKQPKHAGIEVHPGEVDEFDADMLGGVLDALGEHGGEGEADFRVLHQQVVEVGLFQHGAGGGLKRGDGGGARLAGEQRHFTEVLSRAHFAEQEVNAGVRVLLADLNQAAGDEEHRTARRAFTDNELVGQEVAALHALDHLLAVVDGEGAEQFDALQEMLRLGRGLGRLDAFLEGSVGSGGAATIRRHNPFHRVRRHDGPPSEFQFQFRVSDGRT